jgi:hypothetical protein
MVAGMLAVSAVYGAVAVLLGKHLPAASTHVIGNGMPVRLVQSMIAFGLIGVAFAYLGATGLGLLRDPLADRPGLRTVLLGALIGGFLIGRPYPLFHKLTDYALSTHNPLIGALTFSLQSVGNILLVVILAAVMTAVLSTAAGAWVMARPSRVAAITGTVLLALGTFLLLYWDVRLPAHFGYLWFPTAPWNS